MELDISEFAVENEILTANESGVVYDSPRSRIEEAWDRLALYYIQKTSQENKSEITESEFYNCLAHSRVENETAMAVYDLCSKNVLKTYENREYKEERVNIKKHISKELGTILSRRIRELEENVEKESKVFEEIKSHKCEIKASRSQLQIYTGPLDYVEFGSENCKKSTGLSCKIRFKEVEISGFYRKKALSPFEEHKISLLESRLTGKYEKCGIAVLIQRERVETTNEVCTGLLSELLCGRDIEELILRLPVFISRFCLQRIIKGCAKKELIQTSMDTLCDSVSSVFYVKTEHSVVKVDRSNNDMAIFVNGLPVDIRVNE